MSDLRRFGHKWSSSRLRISIIHPSPIRSDQYSTYSPKPCSSDIALAAAAGLSLQGHSVTLYTSGYRQKDIPDYLWDTSVEVKTCLPRIVRLALFSSGYRTRKLVPARVSLQVVSILISLRVIVGCILSYLFNLLWSLLPRRAAARGLANFRSPRLDVVLLFETTIPSVLLSPLFVTDLVYYSLALPEPETCFKKFKCILYSTDLRNQESIVRNHTLYPPVVSIAPSPLTPTHSRQQQHTSGRPYFVILAWHLNISDVFTAIEAFSIFLSSHVPPPGEEVLDDGCTGSTRFINMPRLVVCVQTLADYMQILREANRLKLVEETDVSVIIADSGIVADVLNGPCIAVIHTPTEINETRIPCAAMCSGRPVITTIAFCQTEPVRHESTGLIVKTRSPTSFATGLEFMYNLFISKHTEWNRMGQRGKQRVLSEFSIEMFGSRLDDILENSSATLTPQIGSSPALRPRTARIVSHANALNELGAVIE